VRKEEIIAIRKSMAALTDDELSQVSEEWCFVRQKNIARIQMFQAFADLRSNREHGEAELLYSAFKIDRFVASKILKVAGHAALCDPENALMLPLADEVLYVLATRNAIFVQQAFDEGLIYPSLRRAEAIRLVRELGRRRWARAGRPKLSHRRAFESAWLRGSRPERKPVN